MSKIVHVFYDIPMSLNHASLWALLDTNAKVDSLEKGEFALFLNAPWTAVKLLAAGNAFIYHRSPSNGVLSIDAMRRVVTSFGAARLTFNKNLEDHLLKAFEKKFGKAMRNMKVAFAS